MVAAAAAAAAAVAFDFLCVLCFLPWYFFLVFGIVIRY
jgi:hypothetical protein